MRRRIELDHIARIEGHGSLRIDWKDDRVKDVKFEITEGARLLEGLVVGRPYQDVAPICSRICGICSSVHCLAAIECTEHAFGVRPSPQAELFRDLLLRGENVESHALHLFLLVLPDYLGYADAMKMAADHRNVAQAGLRLKKLGNLIQETVGGRAIHPVTPVIGGFSCYPSTDQLVLLRDRLEEGLRDCHNILPVVVSLPRYESCRADVAFAATRSPTVYGYAGSDDIVITSDGCSEAVSALGYHAITNEYAVPYSHAKHSKRDGAPFMVGALARLQTNGHRITGFASELIDQLHLVPPEHVPLDNNLAQFVELAYDVEHSLQVVEQLLREGVEPDSLPAVEPRACTGTAVLEAPRGLLFYSLSYDDAGRVVAADVVTPTAMNAAGVEHIVRWAGEQFADNDAAELTKRFEMIVRAFDPCISCAVH
jgi:sulfhydrogenase subunit alpha